MNKEEILELFRITSEKIAAVEKETRQKIADSEAKIAAIEEETKQKIADSEAKIAAANQKIVEMETRAAAHREKGEKDMRQVKRNIKHVSKQLGNYTDNIAGISEEYFYQALKGSMTLGNLHFNMIAKNLIIDKREYDILLENGDVALLISVKTTLQPSHIDTLVNVDLPRLKGCFKHKMLYGAVAGLSHRLHVGNLGSLGVFILSLSDQNEVTTLNPETVLRAF